MSESKSRLPGFVIAIVLLPFASVGKAGEEAYVSSGDDSLSIELSHALYFETSGAISSPEDRALEVSTESSLSMTYEFDNVTALDIVVDVEFEASRDAEFGSDTGGSASIDEATLSWDFSSESGSQHTVVGRQTVYDPSGWLWDDTFDALTYWYDSDHWSVLTGLGRTLGSNADYINGVVDPGRTTLMFASAEYRWLKQHWLGVYFFTPTALGSRVVINNQHVNTTSEISTIHWISLRASGELVLNNEHNASYWLGFSTVNGQRTEEDKDSDVASTGRFVTTELKGWAVDLGASYESHLLRPSTFWVGLAFTSGDHDPQDDIEGFYRQTGLQGSSQTLVDGSSVDRYGSTLGPELSNLGVLSYGSVFALSDRTRLDLSMYHYRQIDPGEFTFNSTLYEDPAGNSTDIGRALELSVTREFGDSFEASASAGYFHSGAAFEESTVPGSYTLSLEFNLDL